jgi:hypothetical protein
MRIDAKKVIGCWKDEVLRPNKLWVITSKIAWKRPSGEVIEMSPFLITDYASIPKIFWPIIPKRSPLYDIAAAFHDDIVRRRKLLGFSLLDCHLIFREIMVHFGVQKWKYELMFYAVVISGPFLRGDGRGGIPWKLTEEEKQKYEQIKNEADVLVANVFWQTGQK